MSKKNHSPGPVPPGNRSDAGVDHEEPDRDESGYTEAPQSPAGGDQEQDEKRRLGDFTGKGEPSRRQ
jgi:hypothetical protein